MSAIFTREREQRAAPGLAVPLTEPSAGAAWSFLQDMVPASILSSGSGRLRRRGQVAESVGRRSDTGFLLFYRRDDVTGAVTQTPLKSPTSIQRYLNAQLGAPPADHWCCLQSTQYKARRDGQDRKGGFTADQARHLLMFVVDLDGAKMDPLFLRLMQQDWYAFLAFLDEMLNAIGITSYRVVRSGPEGAHVYLPFVRPDGRPLRATEDSLDLWTKVARALNRYLSQLGADENAVKPTQPFAVPGLPRAKHVGFIPYIGGGQDGAPVDIYTLLRALAARKLVHQRDQGQVIPLPSSEASVSPQERLREIVEQAAGVGIGDRNQVAHDICVYLLAKSVAGPEAWKALTEWNQRNTPPLSEMELRGCFKSAQGCPDRHPSKFQEMQRAPWNRLRGMLGLPMDQPAGYRKDGRWRPLTPAKPWLVRKAAGGREHYGEVAERLLRLIAGSGGQVKLTQDEICSLIDTNRSTLKAVLTLLEGQERLLVMTKRGRGGSSTLMLPEELPINGHSGNSTEGVQQGEWVGAEVPCFNGRSEGVVFDDQVTAAVVGDGGHEPLGVLREVVQATLGVDLYAASPVPVLMVLESAGAVWRIAARNAAGEMLLRDLGRRHWWMEELQRRLGCWVVLGSAVWRPPEGAL